MPLRHNREDSDSKGSRADARAQLEHTARRDNHGVILRSDALAAGMSKNQIDRRVRRCQWVSGPGRNTLMLAEQATNPLPLLHAANLAFGAIAWGRSALAMWGLVDHPRRPIIASDRRPKSQGFDIVYVGDISSIPQTRRKTIHTATLEIALASMAAHQDERSFNEIIDEALRQGLTTWPRIELSLRQFAKQGRSGSAAIHRLIADRSEDTGIPLSAWSRDVSRKLVRSGLPRPKMEHRVLATDTTLIAQVDLAYPEFRYAIELDSIQFHLNSRAFEVDRERDANLSQVGWRVGRFTWSQFSNRWDWVLATIRSQLTPVL